jgi:hypothetical protein
MSTLHTNTVETSSGGAVTLTKQSAAKAHTQLSTSGTTELLGSLNFSSVTDVGTGLADLFFTNNFSGNSYANPATADGGGSTQAVVSSWHNFGNAYRSTAANSIGIRNINDNSIVDRSFVVIIYCGDLA